MVYTEAALGVHCDTIGSSLVKQDAVKHAVGSRTSSSFFSDRYHNNPSMPEYYQGEVASVVFGQKDQK